MWSFKALKGQKAMNCKQVIRKFKERDLERNKENAISVAKELISSLKITDFPVPIVRIMNDLGFYVYSAEMPEEKISGFIMINPDIAEKIGSDRIVAVSCDDLVGRQRFTIAHEFAHYLFDFNEKTQTNYFDTYDTEKSNEPCEAIPSRFAAEFLMPEDMFVRRFNELKKGSLTRYDIVSTLVEDFQVSRKAVEKRCEEVKSRINWSI